MNTNRLKLYLQDTIKLQKEAEDLQVNISRRLQNIQGANTLVCTLVWAQTKTDKSFFDGCLLSVVMREGMINAIVQLRLATGMDLAEAKSYIDNLQK